MKYLDITIILGLTKNIVPYLDVIYQKYITIIIYTQLLFFWYNSFW